ncbi:MAG: hypothetical protein HYX36_09900 [Rhizobiales bacterium]|nr:hypothetical protein [Hyphomicrobiales bacterium]
MNAPDRLVLSGAVAIAGGGAFPHARRRLGQEYPGIDWRAPGPGANTPLLRLVADEGLAEGAFRIATESRDGVASVVTVTGGSVPGVLYGVEELIRRGGSNPARVSVDANPIAMSPGLTYRTFWTWDHSTNWELSQIGQQEIGVFNPYSKPPGGFLADYRRVVDYCSRNRIAAIVIYGFLRNSHGGIAAAQELCRYASERGVRIIPGVAIGSYGGVYWEGDHPYNLATWLKKYPQFAATMEKGVGFQLADLSFPLNFPRSDYTMTACPSAPETMDWMTEAVAWLAETFEIGGVNIESGDYGVCGCTRCVTRRDNAAEAQRRQSDTGDSWSHTDMAENFPRLFAAANGKRKNLWNYCEMQWDNLLDPVAHAAQRKLPRGGIYQHTANRSYWGRLQRDLGRDYVENLPTQPNVLRCQFACQWNGDERTERYALNARTFASMAQFCARMGMQGLTVWGEPSPFDATVELSYLAFARFGYDTGLTWQRFVDEDVAPLLGGRAAAGRFIALAEELDGNRSLPMERLAKLRGEARDHGGTGTGEAARRWMTLEDRIAKRQFMGR